MKQSRVSDDGNKLPFIYRNTVNEDNLTQLQETSGCVIASLKVRNIVQISCILVLYWFSRKEVFN